MDIRAWNRDAWNRYVEAGNQWTIPVSDKVIAKARQGQWEIVLTPTKPVPKPWLGELVGAEVLCLASGGGQQGPILAAAGAKVTIFDNSPKQLAQDASVAAKFGLDLRTVEGDMRELSALGNQTFDLIVHPCSNCFVPEIQPVWNEAYRVLKPGGVLLSGFTSPVRFLFHEDRPKETGVLEVMYSLPFSDLTSLNEEDLQKYIDAGEALQFGHTLEAQIGGQLQAGFVLVGFYEDGYPDATEDLLTKFTPSFIATRAVKPSP
ncbi:MAG: class I SAM-dependent methyltransferase [Gemmataceae bacterium]